MYDLLLSQQRGIVHFLVVSVIDIIVVIVLFIVLNMRIMIR